MNIITGTLAALLILLPLISTQSIGDLCQQCTMTNGAGYRDYPSDCSKYLHCYIDANGNLYGEVRQCAFSTYWDNDVLTCRSAEDTPCLTDTCTGQANGVKFGGEGNCRGFWECNNGRPVAKCCPQGQYWNDTEGCVDDDLLECFDSCFNDEKQNDTETTNVACEGFRAYPGNPGFYEQLVHGNWVPMPCAYGSIFSEELCMCATPADNLIPAPTCKPEIYLPFTADHEDESGNGFYVRNENVLVTDGVAKFNGINSRLIIPRFTNIEHGKTVIIKIKYVSNHQSFTETHAVVSNSDCGNLPSILIAEDSEYVSYAVGTSMSSLVPVTVPQDQSTGYKDLVYEFNNGKLTGYNGMLNATESAPGYLKNVQCALHIGHADNLRPFKGEIDEVTVYLCDPEQL